MGMDGSGRMRELDSIYIIKSKFTRREQNNES